MRGANVYPLSGDAEVYSAAAVHNAMRNLLDTVRFLSVSVCAERL